MTRTNLKIHCGKLDPVPLIDLFFLLLIFVLIGSSLVFHPGIQVQLPQTSATELRGLPKIVVTITMPRHHATEPAPDAAAAGGSPAAPATPGTPHPGEEELLFFNDSQVSWPDLEERMLREVHDRRLAMGRTATEEEKVSGHRAAPFLVLRADAKVRYEKIVRVMSLGRSLGLGVYLVTDPGRARSGPPGSGMSATTTNPPPR